MQRKMDTAEESFGQTLLNDEKKNVQDNGGLFKFSDVNDTH